ncbi:MAG: hypothetical protein KUG61_10990 [Parvibaculaceae bacterium]|nr:hypothetical protein [Parvibaculaceae bacterium]
MSLMEITDPDVSTGVDRARLLQTLIPALSNTDRFGLPVDAPHAQWVRHVVQIGTCKNELNDAHHINVYLEHSDCGAVWLPAPLAKTIGAGAGCFAHIDDHSFDGTAYGTVYEVRARFSRVRIEFVGTHQHPIPICALALIGPPTI